MVLVEEAEKIIQSTAKHYGTESIPFENALGRILGEDIKADRDLPPFNRSTMDGIAVNYEAIKRGIRSFNIKGTQAAGDTPIEINELNECIEIMTGAAVPSTANTIIRYEDLFIKDKTATLLDATLKQGQNIHVKGSDKKQNEIIAAANQVISPDLMGIAASVGRTTLIVKKYPKVVIISTGDELVEVAQTPTPFQIRQSNSYTIKAVLQQNGLIADRLHIADDFEKTKQQIDECLQQYDVIILSGGISMGKFDYVPEALEKLAVQKLFHKVQQRPGKPFWFGAHANGVLVFAFPGNPVSTFMCLHRYFIPWLKTSLSLQTKSIYAILDQAITFSPALQYFLQVKLIFNNTAQLLATPAEGNGSGDFANLLEADAFLELPLEQDNFMQGEVFRIWPFKQAFR